MAMDGNQDAEVAHLKESVCSFAACLRDGHLSHIEVNQAVHTTISKTLEYPMEAISLTDAQWTSITWPLWLTALPRMGVTRFYPKRMRYAPRQYTGLGFLDPYHLNYIKQMLALT